MKVYTKKDYDYRQTVLENIKNVEPLFQTNKVIEFNQPFSYRGRNYMSCMHDPENDILIVESFELKEIPDEYLREVTVSYCSTKLEYPQITLIE